MNKTALIFGVCGQDGSYLSRLLISKGYIVWGTTRDVKTSSFVNLEKLEVKDKIKLVSLTPHNFQNVLTLLQKSSPDEVYYLAGQSSVGLSFEQPTEALNSNVLGIINILESCRLIDKQIRVYYAGSSECFGDTNGVAATEKTPFHPQSPYAVAKASAFWLVNNYRESYSDLFICCGILFNHESPLRPINFVTQKIITTANRIANGSDEILELGRLDISRDWGWAPEYVEAMWLMLQNNVPEDFIIASGETNTLEAFVIEVFNQLDLNWTNHVKINEGLLRPTDIKVSIANPAKAIRKLNWKAQYKMREVIEMMLKPL
jgi:GDPmannose 4,6-dehydratase